MKLWLYIRIRLGLYRIRRQDVARWTFLKETSLLVLCLRYAPYPERAAAARALGRLKATSAIPKMIPLLWDDYESVAEAARSSLSAFLPNPVIEKEIERADAYRQYREVEKDKQAYIMWHKVSFLPQPGKPLIDRSKMERLAKVRQQLQKSIRFW